MQYVFSLSLLLGLGLGVASMITGIDRRLQRRGRPGVLNLPTIGAFLSVFGASGYLLLRYSTLALWVTLLMAAVLGLAAAGAVVYMIVGWAVPSAARDVEDERYILQGHFGVVTRAIASEEEGEIQYEDEGTTHTVAARTFDGAAIPVGSEIVIERIEDGVAWVELWANIARQLELPA